MLDPKSLPVTFSERIRNRERIINSRLNLTLHDVVLLSITHREIDYASSFAMDVVGINGKGILAIADTEFPKSFVMAIEGLVASIPIVDE